MDSLDVKAPLLLVALVFIYTSTTGAGVARAQSVPGMFIFGDSLVDPGNNDYILTLAKSNWYPNGIDYPAGATGRFCNGRTVADVVAERMGLPSLPAYLDPKVTNNPSQLVVGVNYASAAGGILDGTGVNFIGRIGINQQLEYFKETQQKIRTVFQTPAEADSYFANAFYYFDIGSNDYINNYLLPISATRPNYTPEQFQDLLVSEYTRQVIELYNLGARKISVFSVGPLGCIPSQLALQGSPDGSCLEFINTYVRGFNSGLLNMVNTLPNQYPGLKMVYGNSYDLVIDKVRNPSNYGLTNVNNGCCGLGTYRGQIPCIPLLPACTNRDEYLFWDPYHPTDAVNVQLGDAFFSGPLTAITPMNLQQLANL